MKICYEGKELNFDLEELTLEQATVIYKRLGLTLLDLDKGLIEGNPDALRAIYWMIVQNDDPNIQIEDVNFKIVKFANAVQEAVEKEQAEAAEKESAGGPKDE
jgi:phosphoglycolate phosphatase-like HAD superfamily hydrolase